ncbi:MAG TPA: hypothetical protein VFG37_12350 [Planctomycetota bacterium]|nr:hypothetical protein [Planctomycetota bacterium]
MKWFARVGFRSLGFAVVFVATAAFDEARAGDWYVNIGDPGCASGDGSQGAPFCDIGDALAVAVNGDVIHVAAGNYVELLLITKSVTISGAGLALTFVDGNYQGTVVRVTSGTTVRLEDLTLLHGDANVGKTYYGGGVSNAGTLTLERVAVTGCKATNGGGLYNLANLTLSHCTISGNSAYGYDGGGIKNKSTGTLTMTHCEVTGNYAYYSGGGISNFGAVDGTYCTIAGNSGYTYYGGGVDNHGTLDLDYALIVDNHSGGMGGGINNDGGSVVLTNGTIAGNSTYCVGGGVQNSASFVAHHTIVAGNTASCFGPDFAGTLDSSGFNLVADTDSTTIVGDPTGNQLGVDPEFVDAAGGDYALAATSPAIDAGDAARSDDLLRDLAGTPRILDGDLDRTRIVDLGPFEFSHVRLAVTGTPTPGGALTVTATGTAGMTAILCVGADEGALLHPKFGALFVDLSTLLLFPLGTLPVAPLNGTIPPSTPLGTTIALQLLALSGGAGNFSNPVILTVE